jgi:hypothetical protein
MLVLMIFKTVYGMFPFGPDDIMIASRVGVILLAEVVESIICRTKYPQPNLQEHGDK